MVTSAALRSRPATLDDARTTVRTLAGLLDDGWTPSQVRANVAARRWQRHGRAVVLHNGAPSPVELRRIVLLTCASRAVLTSFTAAEVAGLTGWEREAIHVLVPGGTHVTRPPGIPVRVHYTADWTADDHLATRQLHRIPHALVLAAASFRSARPACGILAAGVQQRLVTAGQLRGAVTGAPRVRHRRLHMLAVEDIEQGAGALSEIDFGRLCRSAGLPAPTRQVVRAERSGRRRYLDAEWPLSDGRRLVVEIDGALHLTPRRWWDDQLRQNELVIAGDVVLRFPSAVVRAAPALVVGQLARLLR